MALSRMRPPSQTPLLLRFWILPDRPPSNPDCFVIPSYALKSRTEPNSPTKAEIELAREWWKRFPNAKLILSTGDNQGLGIPNSAVMAAYARRLGIPQPHIIEEDQSLNTYENLYYSARIMEREGLKHPTLVTLDLYTRRAVATARKLGMGDLCWLSAFSRGEPAHGYKWLQTHSRLTIFCYEVCAMIYSRLVGWV
jgi:vancomycin permeability regulator SanA